MYLFVNILLMPVLSVRYLIYTNRIIMHKRNHFHNSSFKNLDCALFVYSQQKNVSQYLSKIHLQLTEFIIKFLVAHNVHILN